MSIVFSNDAWKIQWQQKWLPSHRKLSCLTLLITDGDESQTVKLVFLLWPISREEATLHYITSANINRNRTLKISATKSEVVVSHVSASNPCKSISVNDSFKSFELSHPPRISGESHYKFIEIGVHGNTNGTCWIYVPCFYSTRNIYEENNMFILLPAYAQPRFVEMLFLDEGSLSACSQYLTIRQRILSNLHANSRNRDVPWYEMTHEGKSS